MDYRDLHDELNRLGFARVGKTTHKGSILELVYFDRDGVKVEINFRDAKNKPVNTVGEVWD